VGERLPVIYVRGFAGGTRGIDAAVDDPFYGFNAGSTHVRVGEGGEPRFYQFESPLLRLMHDEGYHLRVEGGQHELLTRATDDSLPAATIWIHRFYDAAASTFGREPNPYRLEQAAEGLRDFIELVLAKTNDAERVHLVAHSMGGLVCRSLLQRVLDDPNRLVSKLFTYGTPHGGIEIEPGGGIGEWFIDTFGPNGSDIFRPRRMYEYLNPAGTAPLSDAERERWDPRSLGASSFPPARVFCLVGTNARDYGVAAGMSARAVGVKSDGLVQIRNAYVKGANRGYVHRAHSGPYGLVNSEEGYQNLRRFLFGNLKTQIGFLGLELDTSGDRTWQADVRLSIRGLPVVMHEQTAAHHCPVQLLEEMHRLETPDSPIPLVTTYLLPTNHVSGYARYALSLKVISLREEGGFFNFRQHLEQVADWQDVLIIDVQSDDEGQVHQVRWQWNSTLPGAIADTAELRDQLLWAAQEQDVGWRGAVPVPDAGRQVLGPKASLGFLVTTWD
jgi:pimeloyl-ACP methyl ester carboxylesterase